MMPIQVTAMLPIVLFPFWGISVRDFVPTILNTVHFHFLLSQSSETVCSKYLSSTNMMFVGGIMLSIAVQSSQLHRRLALTIINSIGCNLKRIHFSIMLSTSLLAMWLPNAAAASMMCPIAGTILNELELVNLL